MRRQKVRNVVAREACVARAPAALSVCDAGCVWSFVSKVAPLSLCVTRELLYLCPSHFAVPLTPSQTHSLQLVCRAEVGMCGCAGSVCTVCCMVEIRTAAGLQPSSETGRVACSLGNQSGGVRLPCVNTVKLSAGILCCRALPLDIFHVFLSLPLKPVLHRGSTALLAVVVPLVGSECWCGGLWWGCRD